MFNISTNGIVRTVLISSFVVALLIGAGLCYFVLHGRAVERVAVEAGRLLTTATAIRSYTEKNIAPALRSTGSDKFHQETVPAFAAQAVYQTVQGTYPGYTYREPALKPTNPANLPTPFEVELINKFRANPDWKEVRGVRNEGSGSVYYLARPLKVQEACLTCHDTPQRAPVAMVAKYGPVNGFGWQLNETIAIQSLTVPASEVLKETGELVMILAGGLLVVFVATYFALTFSIDSLVVRPLRALEKAAETASTTTDAVAPLPTAGAQEIRSIAEAIERLRASLGKALKRLPGNEPGDGKGPGRES